MRKMKCFMLCFCVILLLASPHAVVASDDPIVIRFSHVVSENTPKGVGAKLLKEMVEEQLNGRVKVEIYPTSQKFTDSQAILALLFGDLEMAAPSFPKFRKYTNALQVFDLPFLFENVEQVHAFQDSAVGNELLSSMENLGLTGLAYWDNGMRVLSSNKPIQEPEDMRGMSFRIESSLIFQEKYKKFGALAIPMPFKRLPSALREGVVDGYENAWSNILSKELHKMRPFFTEVNSSYLGYMLVSSTKFWDSLPADVRVKLEEIIAEVTQTVNALAVERALSDKKKVVNEKGITLTKLTAEQKRHWKESMKPIWEQYRNEIGPELITAAQQNR